MDKELKRQRRVRKIWSKIKVLAKISLRARRSNQHMYADILSPEGQIIVQASSLDLLSEVKGQKKAAKITKKEQASQVGKLIAQKALAKGISKLAFNRNGYKFHGRVAAMAEAAKIGGLEF